MRQLHCNQLPLKSLERQVLHNLANYFKARKKAHIVNRRQTSTDLALLKVRLDVAEKDFIVSLEVLTHKWHSGSQH